MSENNLKSIKLIILTRGVVACASKYNGLPLKNPILEANFVSKN